MVDKPVHSIADYSFLTEVEAILLDGTFRAGTFRTGGAASSQFQRGQRACGGVAAVDGRRKDGA